jgi:hypothetical protein
MEKVNRPSAQECVTSSRTETSGSCIRRADRAALTGRAGGRNVGWNDPILGQGLSIACETCASSPTYYTNHG